jgi:hypothetical protein
MRRVLTALTCTWLAGSAAALDITTCGQEVPEREVGVLQVDLDCAGTPGRCEVTGDPCLTSAECAPWACEPNLRVGRRATLDLNGHTLINTAIQCPDSTTRTSRCVIHGPGTVVGDGAIRCISAGPYGNTGHLIVTDVDIQGCRFGIRVEPYNSSLKATNVTANDNVRDGIVAGKLRATDVTTNRNGDYGIFAGRVRARRVTANDNGESGIYPISDSVGRARISNLTATGNGEAGVLAYKVVLRDSVVTGNQYAGADVDIAIIVSGDYRTPRLVRTTCDHSARVNLDDVLADFDICTGD